MIDYNWVVETCEYEVASGGITVAHWRVVATEGDESVSAYGSVGFTQDPKASTFKPYNEVTEEEVLAWVWGSDVDKAAVEASLSKQLQAKKAPKIAIGTPW